MPITLRIKQNKGYLRLKIISLEWRQAPDLNLSKVVKTCSNLSKHVQSGLNLSLHIRLRKMPFSCIMQGQWFMSSDSPKSHTIFRSNLLPIFLTVSSFSSCGEILYFSMISKSKTLLKSNTKKKDSELLAWYWHKFQLFWKLSNIQAICSTTSNSASPNSATSKKCPWFLVWTTQDT